MMFSSWERMARVASGGAVKARSLAAPLVVAVWLIFPLIVSADTWQSSYNSGWSVAAQYFTNVTQLVSQNAAGGCDPDVTINRTDFIDIDLGSEVPISGVRWTLCDGGSGSLTVYGGPSFAYTMLTQQSGLGNGTHEFTFAPYTTRYVRLHWSQCFQCNTKTIGNFEFLSAAYDPLPTPTPAPTAQVLSFPVSAIDTVFDYAEIIANGLWSVWAIVLGIILAMAIIRWLSLEFLKWRGS